MRCLRNHLYVLCCHLSVQSRTLREADPPAKESYQISIKDIPKPGKLEVSDRTGPSCHTGRGVAAVQLMYTLLLRKSTTEAQFYDPNNM
jgi:hypothetical protein